MTDDFRHQLETIIENANSLYSGIEQLSGQLSAAHARIDELENQTKPQPPPPPSNPAPDIHIALSGVGEFRPEGEGEPWPLSGETCWSKDLSPEVRVRVDVLGEQIVVSFQRCWGDLSMAAPVLLTNLVIVLDGEEVRNAPFRLHRQQRCVIVFRRRALDTTRLPAGLPNLRPRLTEGKALAIANGTTREWETMRSSGSDEVSEDFGLVRASWTGGGHPLANEAALFPPWDSALIGALAEWRWLEDVKQALFRTCVDTARTSGNYPIHFFNRATGQPYKANEAAALPLLSGEAIPPITSRAGVRLPIPDIAHDFGLANLAGLLTRERWFVEEMRSWVLLGSLTRQGATRASGIFWSGQTRATAWWLRNLLYLCVVLEGEEKKEYEKQLRANLEYMTNTFTVPTAKDFRATGIVSVVDYKFGEPARFFRDGTAKMTQTTFAFHLITVLREVRAVGYREAEPMLRYLLKIVRGMWEVCDTRPEYSRHLACWPMVAYAADDWSENLKATFTKLTKPPASFAEVKLTDFYVAAWRSALVAAIELDRAGNTWAVEALAWVDQEMKKWGKPLPLAWAVEPRA